MQVFENVTINNCKLQNRIIRSATFEGMCDSRGFPGDEYHNLYAELARHPIGAIITGFAYVSPAGKAMQPGQAGIYSEEFVPYYKKTTDEVHRLGGKIFMQLAHTGRQTLKSATQLEVVGASNKRSPYFKGRPRRLLTDEVYTIVEQFGDAAKYAKQAGFDGVQIHAAHGYLVHQFITPAINSRNDEFGIDRTIKIGTKFLGDIIDDIRQKCGNDYPLLVKISGSDDLENKFTKQQFINLVQFIDSKKLDAIEVSYGTMDYALNIIRGDVPVDLVLMKNAIYKTRNSLLRKFLKTFVFPSMKKRFIPFERMYNLPNAIVAKEHTKIPIITVGGYRERHEIEHAIEDKGIDFVSICRPFLSEPDYIEKIMKDQSYVSRCQNCNFCAIMCDTEKTTKCYKWRVSYGYSEESNGNN